MAEVYYIVTLMCFACPQCHRPIPDYYQVPRDIVSDIPNPATHALNCKFCSWAGTLRHDQSKVAVVTPWSYSSNTLPSGSDRQK
jgi:hypothetical protein